jgi:hypothetical protein
MNTLPPADLGYVEEVFQTATQALIEAYEDSGEPTALRSATPEVQTDAGNRLLKVLRSFDDPETEHASTDDEAFMESKDLQALGDYGIHLMADLAAWAQALHQADALRGLRLAGFALTRWLAQRGAELSTLEPVVDTLAFVANSIRTPAELERLFLATREIMDAVNPAIAQDLDHSSPGRPWRLLVLNQAIIATRSHQPRLMEEAFQLLVDALPEDAAHFFREGMEQMDALDYPAPVRQVMEKYFQLWCPPATLH